MINMLLSGKCVFILENFRVLLVKTFFQEVFFL